jgi:DNA (cytosine-5)-methyltransferase 1
MARIINEVRPLYAIVENSPALTVRGLGTVLGDLAAMGFNARWGVLGAGHIGGWHLRERIWVVASDPCKKRAQRGIKAKVQGQFSVPWLKNVGRIEDLEGLSGVPDPLLRRVRNGMASYVDRISAIGNGQVPAVAALAFNTLSASI